MTADYWLLRQAERMEPLRHQPFCSVKLQLELRRFPNPSMSFVSLRGSLLWLQGPAWKYCVSAGVLSRVNLNLSTLARSLLPCDWLPSLCLWLPSGRASPRIQKLGGRQEMIKRIWPSSTGLPWEGWELCRTEVVAVTIRGTSRMATPKAAALGLSEVRTGSGGWYTRPYIDGRKDGLRECSEMKTCQMKVYFRHVIDQDVNLCSPDPSHSHASLPTL